MSTPERSGGFVIWGIVAYYLGSFIGGILIVIISEYNGNLIDESDETWLGFAGIPFGLLAAYGLYKGLERSWKNARLDLGDGTLDSVFLKDMDTSITDRKEK